MNVGRLRHRALLLACAAVAGAAAVLSLPSDRERLALLERDGLISEALQQISHPLSSGQDDPSILDLAVRLHLRLGDVKSAIEAVELYDAALPDNLAVQSQLLDLLRDDGTQRERYMALAERIYDRWGEPRVLRDLLDHYRISQDLEKEVRLLELATGTGYATSADIERLAMIKAAQGDYSSAMRLLIDGDDTREGIGRAARITLFSLLIEQARLDDAIRRAIKWLAAGPDDRAAVQFCARLALSGHVEHAVTITRRAKPHENEVNVTCAEWVFRSGETERVSDLLVTWAGESRTAGPETLRRYIQLTEQIDRPDLVSALVSAGPVDVSPSSACSVPNEHSDLLRGVRASDCREQRDGN
jgi:hypothetical protein